MSSIDKIIKKYFYINSTIILNTVLTKKEEKKLELIKSR